jgi:hypothetical protein
MGVSNYTVTKKDILKQYVITFKDNTEVIVEDFVDIRYDYTKNTLREIIDHEIITMYIKKILELSKNVSSREGSK